MLANRDLHDTVRLAMKGMVARVYDKAENSKGLHFDDYHRARVTQRLCNQSLPGPL